MPDRDNSAPAPSPELTLNEVLAARRTATHAGPPRRRIRFYHDGTVEFAVGGVISILTAPSTAEPQTGWRHRAGCSCQFCTR